MNDTQSFDEENKVDKVIETTKKYVPKIRKAPQEKRKSRVNLFTFIIITIFYISVLVLGILSVCDIKAIWDETYQNRLGGIWFIVLFSSYFMFFFGSAPFLKNKKIRKGFFVLFAVIFTALQLIPILYLVNNEAIFHAINKVGMWNVFDAFVFSLITIIGSYISTMLLYIIPWFSYNFDKIEEFKELDPGDSGIAKVILYFFLDILIGIYWLVLLIPKLREKNLNVYFLLFLPLSIFIQPFAAETIALILITVIIVFFISLIEGIFFNGSGGAYTTITVVDEAGHEIEIYDCGGYYKDDYGHFYNENSDGTFSPE